MCCSRLFVSRDWRYHRRPVPKSIRRTRRRPATTDAERPRRDSLVPRDAGDQRPLLDRILDTPHLAHVIPRLPPEMLHGVIQRCGLEDCSEIVALATPEQLTRVFDLDLWRADRPGRDEQFDADRFGVWLEVLVEAGAEVAAQKVADMDVDLVTAALAQHMRVFDRAAITLQTMDGEDVEMIRGLDAALSCDVGGYLVVATRTDSWNAIVAVLMALDAEHRAFFHRVMPGCRRLSSSRPEVDGLDDLLTDREQAAFDLACGRERRRDTQGYATPAQARAFLQMSRQFRLGQDLAAPDSPIARAYFRAIDSTDTPDAPGGPSHLLAAADATTGPDDHAQSIAAVVDVLREAGVLPPPPRALLDGPREEAPRLARLHRHLQFASDADGAAYSTRSQELAYLANTLVAGCSIQARTITAQEASDAAVAVCNLGLENWPAPLPDDFLVGHDLVSVFQIGWRVLYEEVCMHTAERLIGVLTDLRCDDRETQAGLNALRREMTTHWRSGTPWRARDALDVIAILDLPAWAALLALIDECPVMHGAIVAAQNPRTRAVSATGFAFISDNSQIAAVHAFVEALPDTLCG
jgi:hypothetical protein